jgi:hypothetical protein
MFGGAALAFAAGMMLENRAIVRTLRPGQFTAYAVCLVLVFVLIVFTVVSMQFGMQWIFYRLLPDSFLIFIGLWFVMFFVWQVIWRAHPLLFRVSASVLSAACLWLILFILTSNHTQEINCQPGPNGAMKWECLSDTPPPQPSDWDVVDRKPLR